MKANQPTLRQEVETFFRVAPEGSFESVSDVDKGHGRIERRDVAVAREVDWLQRGRCFPGELRLPDAAAIIRVESKVEMRDRCRFDTRYYISSSAAPAEKLAQAASVRLAPEELIPKRRDLRRKTSKPRSPRKTPIKRRRQLAGWSTDYLAAVLQLKPLTWKRSPACQPRGNGLGHAASSNPRHGESSAAQPSCENISAV